MLHGTLCKHMCSEDPHPRFFAAACPESGPNRWRGSSVSRIKVSYAMAYVAQVEESYVTLRIGFGLYWASSHWLTPRIADKKDAIRRRAVRY